MLFVLAINMTKHTTANAMTLMKVNTMELTCALATKFVPAIPYALATPFVPAILKEVPILMFITIMPKMNIICNYNLNI